MPVTDRKRRAQPDTTARRSAFANALIAALAYQSKTQGQIAEIVGVSDSALSDWKLGKGGPERGSRRDLNSSGAG